MCERPIDEIVNDALERDPSEWSQFVDSACGGNEHLRSEVESFLSIERSCPDLLQLPARGEEPVPDRLGPYRIVRRLARGGMGIVFEGFDDQLKRRVAIKVLPRRLAHDHDWRLRFEREAQLLAAMNHPNVATIHSLERDGDRFFLTMELLEGATLADRVADGAIAIDEGLEICRQIARALQAVHEKGIIHCDLKPRNVAMTKDGSIKVIDFGLARPHRTPGAPSGVDPIDEDAAGHDRSSQVGESVTGTPGYMSPEQVRGDTIDHRSDIWAFGCILFECLTGHPAFAGKSLTERLEATLEGEPGWSLLDEDVPDRILTLLKSCLMKDPGERLGRIEIARNEIEQETALRARPGGAGREPEAPLGNLPLSLDDFLGRGEERDAIRRSLERSHLVTLVGAGGCGKTRLAIETGLGLGGRFEDGVWFVDLSPVALGDELIPAILSVLEVSEEPSLAPIDSLLRFVEGKRLLLLLDNCEHLLDSCTSLVERMGGGSSEVVVLATSREALHAAEEIVLTIPPLPVPDTDEVDDPKAVEAFDSVRLFLARARAVQPDLVLTAENAADIAKLCRRLDGIPLALELAAAQMAERSVAQIVQLLESRGDFLDPVPGTAVAKHKTLRSLIDWSYSQLDPKAQRLFRRLSAFSGGWTLDAAEAVCAGEGFERWETFDLLSALLDKNLIELDERATRSSGKVRYRFLETIRSFAGDRLHDSSERKAAQRRHVDWAVGLAEKASTHLEGAEQTRWLSILDSERDNLRRALETALQDGGQPEAGFRIAHAMERYWLIRGHWREGRRLSHETLKMGAAGLPGDRHAQLLLAAGSWDLRMGDPERALRCYEEALSVSRRIEERDLIARSLHNIGGVALHRGDLEGARSRFEEYLAIETDLGNRRAVGVGNNSLGLVAEREGDFARARSLYSQSLVIWRDLGDRRLVALLSNNVGAMALNLGDLSIARAHFMEAIESQRKLGYRADLASTLHHLGMVEQMEGNLGSATRLLNESLTICRELEDLFGISRALTLAADLAFTSDRTQTAAHLFGASEGLREQIDRPLSPKERQVIDPMIERVRSSLGAGEFDRLHEEGRSMALDRVIAIAMGQA